MTLIAEDLLLLLLDDDKGTLSGTSHTSTVLGGAMLIELAVSGAVDLERRGVWRSWRVHPTGTLPADPLLRTSYDVVAEKPRSAQALVTLLGKGLRDPLADRLVERGILERRESKVLGLFPRTTWPAVDTRHEDEVRDRLTAALVRGEDPDDRTGALVALLAAVDRAHRVVPHEGVSTGQVRKRAKAIAEGAWAAKAVRDAIAASTAAIAAATSAATTAAVVSS